MPPYRAHVTCQTLLVWKTKDNILTWAHLCNHLITKLWNYFLFWTHNYHNEKNCFALCLNPWPRSIMGCNLLKSKTRTFVYKRRCPTQPKSFVRGFCGHFSCSSLCNLTPLGTPWAFKAGKKKGYETPEDKPRSCCLLGNTIQKMHLGIL